MKCKNVFSLTFEPFISKCIFLRLRHFFSPSAYPISSILPVYKILDFDEAFFHLAAVAMINEIFFFSVSMAAIPREANSFITIMQLASPNYP